MYNIRVSNSNREVMAYGMEQLRKAGRAFLDFDKKYADAIYDSPYLADSRGEVMTEGRQRYRNMRGLPLEDVPGYTIVRDEAGNELPSDFRSKLNDFAYGAANVGARYALPAYGVTVAGKGLYDLTAAFGNGADYPEEGSLPL